MAPERIKIEYVGGKWRAKVRGFEEVFGALIDWADLLPPDFEPHDGMTPGEHLVSGLGGCVAQTAVVFCKENNCSAKGLKVELYWAGNPKYGVPMSKIMIDVSAPGVPKNLRGSLTERLEECTLCKSMRNPTFEVKIH